MLLYHPPHVFERRDQLLIILIGIARTFNRFRLSNLPVRVHPLGERHK